MSDVTLYFGLETCARVTMTALVKIGQPFTSRRIDLAAGEQKSAAYLAINPNAEVPALVIDGHVLTQNAAILFHLHTLHPTARLLPEPGGLVGPNEPLQDLLWCSSTLHILRRQVLNPVRFTTGAFADVQARGLEVWGRMLPRIEDRLSRRPWWYGDQWSVIDSYLNWAMSGFMAERLDLAQKPVLLDHEKRLHALPFHAQAVAREREGLAAPPVLGQAFATPGLPLGG